MADTSPHAEAIPATRPVWAPSPIDAVLDEYGAHAIVARARSEQRYCCDVGCGSGACEVCPCCSAGWCVMGTDGIPGIDDVPGDAEDFAAWLDIAKDHNPVAAVLATCQEQRADLADFVATLQEENPPAPDDRIHRALLVLDGAPIPMGEVAARHAAAILRGDRG